MSLAIRRLSNLVSNLALNPVITASLLWALTKGPPQLRNRLINTFTGFQDAQRLGRIVKALKWLVALGLAGTVNEQLNKIALNAWRFRSEKKRWSWDREVVVVTGGCSGIGELVVKRLVNKGMKIAILDIQQLPKSLQGYASIKLFACDVTDANAVNSTAERIKSTWGPPSILINNAAVTQPHTILETSEEFLHKIFEVNVLSNFTTIKAFLPDMISQNKGHVVTVASTASYMGVAGMVDYGATKAAALSLHEGLSQELKHGYKAPNVMTTSVHPNWVRTPLIEPYEKALNAAGSILVDPQVVADAIANQITACEGGQLFIPHAAKRVSSVRGWPNWLQEMIRTGGSKMVLRAT